MTICGESEMCLTEDELSYQEKNLWNSFCCDDDDTGDAEYEDDISRSVRELGRRISEGIRLHDDGGELQSLWVALAKLYENQRDLANARRIFEKAVRVKYRNVDHLTSVWCEWAEMELRHENPQEALDLMRRCTSAQAAADGSGPAQMNLHKSPRLWAFYADLEESLGSPDSTRAMYERMLDLGTATPQTILKYASLLEQNGSSEDAFKMYERGVEIFEYPLVNDIWAAYIAKFVERYGETELEHARASCSQIPPEDKTQGDKRVDVEGMEMSEGKDDQKKVRSGLARKRGGGDGGKTVYGRIIKRLRLSYASELIGSIAVFA
ncbi:PREDICTED: pre-mRNA-splicing factor SYF1-like [Tarenaya hassleriana]|uniref:pre-mRNA-splicing factor SYF1-like n=1 Tax=Tarenaya hassleriana TaxID=28532 RepID=UPI00053C87C5|nr:PREDICTED: pre-mRNA-splicing factor SYF1-like [Tarenaya hassleriana]